MGVWESKCGALNVKAVRGDRDTCQGKTGGVELNKTKNIGGEREEAGFKVMKMRCSIIDG